MLDGTKYLRTISISCRVWKFRFNLGSNVERISMFLGIKNLRKPTLVVAFRMWVTESSGGSLCPNLRGGNPRWCRLQEILSTLERFLTLGPFQRNLTLIKVPRLVGEILHLDPLLNKVCRIRIVRQNTVQALLVELHRSPYWFPIIFVPANTYNVAIRT